MGRIVICTGCGEDASASSVTVYNRAAEKFEKLDMMPPGWTVGIIAGVRSPKCPTCTAELIAPWEV